QLLDNTFNQQCHQQDEVDRINLQMEQLYMQQPFLDSRLALINCTIVPCRCICTNVDFVVIVHIRAEDAQGRNIWRATYGESYLRNKFNYSLLFVVGKPRFLINQEIIEEESASYGDILQMDFTDSYRNITLKHLAELRYLASACNDNIVIIKMDDDVAWDIQQISNFVRHNITSDNLFCARRAHHHPFRDPHVKWAATKEEWNETTYPPYCPGYFYLAPISAVKKLLNVAHLQRFFWIDDVLITGVLRRAANVGITNMDTISGDTQYPLNRPRKKIAFLTKKLYVRQWFFAINRNGLLPNQSRVHKYNNSFFY
ncbi:hypothetical protein V3C99_012982, partial [Haemonchus contortus]|uniref:Hexosyltransferase n=1 Tax=Haemonchus contortus TaxID=6289 RepID=A0A7I4Y1M0_HAECO